MIDGWPASGGIISGGYEGILGAPPDQHPQPFEIVFETPHLHAFGKQVDATVAALRAVLVTYRSLRGHAAAI